MDDAAGRLIGDPQVGSGEQTHAPEPSFLTVGQVIGAHGLRGELKVEPMTDDPHRFGLLERVFIGLEGEEPLPWGLEGYRLHQGRVLLKLEECNDRTAAESLREYLVQVPIAEAIPLEEGQYFEHQILGLDVWTASGEPLGRVVEIIYTGANEVYIVHGTDASQRETLIPVIEDVVLDVDLDAGRILVQLPDGLV